MHGNVWEWTQDRFFYYTESELPDPGVAPRFALKGGSWFSLPRNLRSAMRYGRVPGEYNETIGLRLVRIPLERPSAAPAL
jgi:formylglycine-generating enzyme required for sulfatase activity